MLSRRELVDQEASGTRHKYLKFWSHEPLTKVGANCLSQWFPSPFIIDGHQYLTTEHWLMSEKAKMFGDQAALERLSVSQHPGQAKAIGRSVEGYDDDRWSEARGEVAVAGNLAKFDQNPDLRAFLAATGERVLVEASPTDLVWGIGRAANDPGSDHAESWLGENLLGFVLMEVRTRLLE